MTTRAPTHQAPQEILVLLLVSLACLAGLYYGLRYGGWAMEVDASRQALAADGILTTGSLTNERAYNNGFGYAAILAIVSRLAGQPIQAVQIGASAWVFVVALAAFSAYRELLGSPLLAALAALLLLIQPDFLFYVLRGSHEKFTWTFALLLLFLAARSVRAFKRPAVLLASVAAFYLLFWAMTAANVYFAATFINALVLSLAGGWLLNRLAKQEAVAQRAGRDRLLRRLALIAFVCFTLVFVFIHYTYRPALQSYQLFTSLFDRISLLLLGGQPVEQPLSYGQFGAAWRSSATYLALTGVQWLIALASLVAWALDLRRLGRLDQPRWLLWLMYSSFGVLLAFGVLADYARFLNTNLQLRMFTPFALFSSPLAARLVAGGLAKLRPRRRPVALALGAVVAVYAAAAALLKVTNDPAVGNQWLFSSPVEVQADRWINAHLIEQLVWIDTSDHMEQVFDFWGGYNQVWNNYYDYYSPTSRSTTAPYVLITDLTQLRANQVGLSLPPVSGYDRVYDNGTARLYHRRPRTPFQR